MANPVVWFEVMGKNGENLRSFYSELFGWQYQMAKEVDYGMIEANGGQGIPGGVGQSQEQYVTFYISTRSVNSSLEEIGKRGGKTVMPRTELPEGTVIGMFTDPEGNTVGLVEEAA
ncbi:MAG: VOC family protein [Polyangiales bacterium]